MPLPNSYATPMPPGREPIDKAGAWHRLSAEGRLDEFNDRREEIRNELHTKGVKRKQAADDAWRLALAEFPSLPAEPEPATGDVELEMAEEDRVIDCPSCDVRILLKKPDLQKSWDGKAELDWPPPAVCPPDHPNF